MILENVIATFSPRKGIVITAKVGGMTRTLDDLRGLADAIGDNPDGLMDVAWPGRSGPDPEAEALVAAGILESAGSIGAGITASPGPKCREFSDEVYDYARFERLENAMLEKLEGVGVIAIMESEIVPDGTEAKAEAYAALADVF